MSRRQSHALDVGINDTFKIVRRFIFHIVSTDITNDAGIDKDMSDIPIRFFGFGEKVGDRGVTRNVGRYKECRLGSKLFKFLYNSLTFWFVACRNYDGGATRCQPLGNFFPEPEFPPVMTATISVISGRFDMMKEWCVMDEVGGWRSFRKVRIGSKGKLLDELIARLCSLFGVMTNRAQ